MGAYDYWQTDTIMGEVFIYDSTASYVNVKNTFSPFNNSAEKERGLTIKFYDTGHTDCFLESNDTIRSAGGYHYQHSGYFKGDSLYFNVINLGSLGGGSDYYTKGKKLD